ncbi:MAG: dUTP diphosphatase [Propionibacteriaceae bacterium]
MVRIPLVRLDPDSAVPVYAKPGDAGADLPSAEDVILRPGERRVVATGLAVAIPQGYVGLTHPRSGLAATTGLTIVNAPGTIDSGYRGEIKIILLNTDTEQAIDIRRGDRIAQLVIQPVVQAEFVEVDSLSATERGAGGFGSTGLGTAPATGENG